MRKMKRIQYLMLMILCAWSIQIHAQDGWKHGRLRVSGDAHFLETTKDMPFFWLSDAAFDIFQKLSFEEIRLYLKNRQSKGFNVIQAAILAENNGLKALNRYGSVPLVDENPNAPNERYFELVDTTVKVAARRDIFVALYPTWGDKVTEGWGSGPAVFTSRNAYNYGRWLGERYKNDENIIWVLGGDRPPVKDASDWLPIWRAMARGLQEGSSYEAFITYYPSSGEKSSSQYLHNETWLNLNMIHGGNEKNDLPVWQWVERDTKLPSAKPTLDGGINFEDHPVGNTAGKSFTDYDVRKQAYRSVFAGASGVGYGNHAVWQFAGSVESGAGQMGLYWKDGLDRPGAFSAGYVRKLVECRPFMGRVYDPSIIKEGQEEGDNFITAFRGKNNDYAMVYLPVGKTITVNTSFMKSDDIKIWWYDPRIGLMVRGISVYRRGLLQLTPPTLGAGQDWVLVLDDPEYQYRPPGDWISERAQQIKEIDDIPEQ